MLKFSLIFVALMASMLATMSNARAEVDPWNPPLGARFVGYKLAEGWEQPRLLPEPVNLHSGGWTDSLALSDDGRQLLFSYSRFDLSTFLESNGSKFIRSGMPRDNRLQEDEFRIYSANISASGWQVEPLKFDILSTNHMAAPALGDGGKSLLYTTYKMNPYRADIQSAQQVNNIWVKSNQLPLPINATYPCVSDNPTFIGSLNGSATIFFETKRLNEDGSECGEKPELYFAKIVGGQVVEKANRLKGANSDDPRDKDTQPHIMPDGSKLYWTGIRYNKGIYGILSADIVGEAVGEPAPIIWIDDFSPPFKGKAVLIGEPNVARVKEGLIMYFVCGKALDDEAKKRDLNICFSKKRL